MPQLWVTHPPITGTHAHVHGGYGASDSDPGDQHYGTHTHEGDNEHDHATEHPHHDGQPGRVGQEGERVSARAFRGPVAQSLRNYHG
jgi:hypothetical protein